MLNLTGVVVNYETPALLAKSIKSIREFYDFPIIVIDGSPKPCELDLANIRKIDVGYNIGHGLGMDLGIEESKTKYVLTFDTDIEMKTPCLEDMIEKLGDNYSIGKAYYISTKGGFYKSKPNLFPDVDKVKMVHPSFQIVNKEQYLKYAPYISDGAPTALSYHDLFRRGKQDLMIDYPVLDYVYHRNAGTRDVVGNDTDYYQRGHTNWWNKWANWIEENPI